jgi:uncharacterized lipoprotein YddW (UPF0748 family)
MRAGTSAAAFVAAVLLGVPASAQPAQYRAFWVDTFNSGLSNHEHVLAVVDQARAAGANAIFAQVRRRGDSWYLDSREGIAEILPPAPGAPPAAQPIEPGFDPLRDLIAEAHAHGIEVHAFVIVNAIWNRHPTVLPLPAHAAHPFNRHGWDQATGAIYGGRANWLTRSLLPDGTPGSGLTFGGHRIGAEFWMDPGHPDYAAYTVDVLTHLVKNYEVDGLHLDRIRYPELGVAGQTPATGTNIGYNATSVQRFNARYALPPDTVPAQNEARWVQWRRDQVTNLVRRIYLEAVAVKPQVKVSASLIAFGGFSSWPSAEAYWRVYQDWDAWTREGILDIAMPMVYKREHVTNANPALNQQVQFNQWNEWTKDHAYGRATMIGIGNFNNGVEGTLRQVRRALAPSLAGNSSLGVSFFSMATSNTILGPTDPEAADRVVNPFAIPPAFTPLRSFADFAAGLRTGRSVDGTVLFEDPAANPVAVFAEPAAVPDLPWKTLPQVGHLKGVVTDAAGAVVDTGTVTIARLEDGTTPANGRTVVTGATDGNGFYGGVDLAPGAYEVTVTPMGGEPWTAACRTEVAAGQVANLDLAIDHDDPALTVTVDPALLWPPNHEAVAVTVAGLATDAGTGVENVAVRVRDEYGLVQPAVAPVAGQGAARLDWSVGFDLEASRRGEDADGRVYTIEVTVTDRACRSATAAVQVLVPHDRGRGPAGKDAGDVLN